MELSLHSFTEIRAFVLSLFRYLGTGIWNADLGKAEPA